MIKPKLDKDLIVFDVETTGSTYGVSSVIQIGAVHLDKNFNLVREPFCIYVKPYTAEWTQEAESIHGISQEFLKKNGTRVDEAIEQFEEWIADDHKHGLKKVYLGQWACGFDVNMLQYMYTFCKREYPFSYRSYDIASFVRLVLACKEKQTGKSLNILC